MHRDPIAYFRRIVAALAGEAIHAAVGIHEKAEEFLDDAPAGHGDFSLACFPLAKKARKAPPQIASEIVGAIAPDPAVHVIAAGPYVNFTINPRILAKETLGAVHGLGPKYGTGEPTGERILVEHTSANPTGPLHVGRARNPILGDTLTRVLRASGASVSSEYYVNDMGRQAAMLVWGARRWGRTDAPKPDHALVEAYQRASAQLESDAAGEAEIRALIAAFEAGEAETAALFQETVGAALAGIRQTLERLDAPHDSFKFESELVLGGHVSRVVERLLRLPACKDEDGARFLDMAELGSQMGKDKFFILRKDGTTLYGTRDIAYHADKLARADRLVDVLGEDHKLALEHLSLALVALGEERPIDTVFYNFVSLPEGKMSTRSGRVVYLDDLMDEAEERAHAEVQARRTGELSPEQMVEVARMVGIGAVRFNIVSVQAEKQIVFKWEEALAFDGASAPFVQYAHARACSILEKARAEGLHPWKGELSRLTQAAETELLRRIARLPGLVATCAGELKVHPLTTYAVELATQLNVFYRDCPVLKAPAGVREDRLSLVDATRQTLHNVLDLLGVEAPETM